MTKRAASTNDNVNCRALRLLERGIKFIVVAIDEPYFARVFDLIREHQQIKGTWTPEDEDWYIHACDENTEILNRASMRDAQ